MERKLIITYRFNTADIEPVSKENQEILEDCAIKKTLESVSKGFSQGELSCDISEEYTVYGWFEILKTN